MCFWLVLTPLVHKQMLTSAVTQQTSVKCLPPFFHYISVNIPACASFLTWVTSCVSCNTLLGKNVFGIKLLISSQVTHHPEWLWTFIPSTTSAKTPPVSSVSLLLCLSEHGNFPIYTDQCKTTGDNFLQEWNIAILTCWH